MRKLTTEDIKAIEISFKGIEDAFKEIAEINKKSEISMNRLSAAMASLNIEPEEETLETNKYITISERQFVQYSSHSHMLQVNKFEAKLLNKKGFEVYQCTVYNDPDTFTAYLADLSVCYDGPRNHFSSKIHQGKLAAFQELDENHGFGINNIL